MKTGPDRILLLLLLAATPAADLQAFPNPFKRKEEPTVAPGPDQRRNMDFAAGDLMRKAQAEQAAGDNGDALSTYRSVVEKYPLSSHAAAAQFQVGALLEATGKPVKAFDAYQALIDTYRQSPQFGESVKRQFDLAVRARTEDMTSFLGIPKKLDVSEQIEWLQKVIDNAPQGKYAPEAQFEIAKIHEEEESTDAAITAYRKVVDNYPRHPLAADAQTKVGKGYFSKVEGGSRDRENLEKAKAATQDATGLFPGANSSEVDTLKSQVGDAEADKAYETGRFYEKKRNYKAALIYYSDVLRAPGSAHFEEVKERIATMRAADPNLGKTISELQVDTKQLTAQASVDLKSNPGYFGPPAPATASRTLRKPKMRPGDLIPITPLEEPDLPGAPDKLSPTDATLLNPDAGMPAPGTDLTPPEPAPAPGLEMPDLPGETTPAPAPDAPAPATPEETKPAEPATPAAPAEPTPTEGTSKP